MKESPKTILITGARAPIALELARSFSTSGHRVIMADSIRLTIARWSNSIFKYYLIPSPRFKNDAFVSKLKDIITIEKVDHFIPTCEEAIFISEHRNEFPCKVWTSDLKLTTELHSKIKFPKVVNGVFPVPETILLNDFEDWSNSNKYVFKPVYSRFATQTIINKSISPTFFNEDDKIKWVAQKFIKGKEICVYSIWDEGKLKGYAAYHPLYRAGKGSGIFFEPIQNESVFNYVKAFGKNIKYNGQLSFDVIISEEDIPYFIECNPRGVSGAHLLKDQLSKAFLEDDIVVYDKDKEYAIKYAMFILQFASFFKKRVRESKDAIFHWNDMKPFFFQILSLIEITFIKFYRNVSWLEATTGDIEWNNE